MSTLDEMLIENAYLDDADIKAIKKVFQQWLAEVGLTDYYSLDKNGMTINTTESIRQLLIILVDEL